MATHGSAAGLAWITGASSFLGSTIGSRLAARGYDVVGFAREAPAADTIPAGGLHTGPFSRHLLERAVDAGRLPDFIIHCIGSGSVNVAKKDPDADADRTIGSAAILAEFAKQSPSTRLVYLSSAAVYGSGATFPTPESTASDPVSVYGRNKAAAEAVLRNSGSCARIARLFSVYGPPQRKLLFWDLGRRILGGENPVVLGGSGEEVRDFIHVSDAASAIIAIAEAEHCPDVVNVGSGEPTSIRTAADALSAALPSAARIVFDNVVRLEDPRRQTADISRLKALGFQAEMTDLKKGLAEYAHWLVASRPGSH